MLESVADSNIAQHRSRERSPECHPQSHHRPGCRPRRAGAQMQPSATFMRVLEWPAGHLLHDSSGPPSGRTSVLLELLAHALPSGRAWPKPFLRI
jgi:hypothetical protein